METTNTQCGRQTKTPAKFQQNGSLGAAVGGGGLLSTPAPKLPVISGRTLSTTTGAHAANTQSEDGGRRRRQSEEAPAATAAAKGKAKQGQGPSTRESQLDTILKDPQFGGEGEGNATEDVNVCISSSNSSSSSSSSISSDDDDGCDDDDEGEDENGANAASARLGSIRSGGGRSSGSGGGIAATAKAMEQLQKSLRRNLDKDYVKWPSFLLQMACSVRRITGYSKSKKTDEMAKVLQQLDVAMNRSSPFIDDLEDRAAGGTPSSQPLAKGSDPIPETLITATKAAVQQGASFKPERLLTCEGKSYRASAVLAAIKQQERAEGGGESSGSRRKSKHCIPRFCEVIALSDYRARWSAHRTQLTKQELDQKKTSRTRDVMIDVWEAFKDDAVKVPETFADDTNVIAAGIDPNIVHQPDITFDKFIAMKNDIIKDHGDMFVNFKKSGSNGEMYEFCKGSLDTYYYGMMADKYPEIEQATTQMLPEGTESENTGVGGSRRGGAKAAAAAAANRAAAKASAKERNVALGKPEKKRKKQHRDIQDATKVAMATAKEEMGLGALLNPPTGPTFTDAPTSYYDTKEGCEARVAKLDLATKLRKNLMDLKENIKNEEDPDDREIMQDAAKHVRIALKNLSQQPL